MSHCAPSIAECPKCIEDKRKALQKAHQKAKKHADIRPKDFQPFVDAEEQKELDALFAAYNKRLAEVLDSKDANHKK